MEKLDSERPRQTIAEQKASINDRHRIALARRAVHGRVEVSPSFIDLTDVVLEATRKIGFGRVTISKTVELGQK